MNREHFEEEITAILSGEASASDELLKHAEECDEVAALLSLHQEFEMFDVDGQIEEKDLDDMRARVRHTLSGANVVTPFVKRGAPWWATTLAAAAALVVGLLLGGRSEPTVISEQALAPQQAQMPGEITNVVVQDLSDGRIALSYDERRSVEEVVDRNHPMVRDLVLQGLRQPDSLNRRLDTLAVAEDVMDPAVRDVLIETLLAEGALPVRLKTMDALSRYREDPAVRDAFLTVLKDESQMTLRLMAVDYLAGQPVAREELQQLIDELRDPEDIPVLTRIKDLR